VLDSLGITIEAVRAQVLSAVGRGYEPRPGQMPFTARAKRVLDLSLREALSLGHDRIGTEHILLGLVHENSGVAAGILYDFYDASARKVASATLLASGVAPEAAEEVTQRLFSDAPPRSGEKERRITVKTGSRPFWLTPVFVTSIVPILAGGMLLGLGILIGWLIWG